MCARRLLGIGMAVTLTVLLTLAGPGVNLNGFTSNEGPATEAGPRINIDG